MATEPPATGTLKARLPPLLLVRAFERWAVPDRCAGPRPISASATRSSSYVRSLEEWLGTKLLDRGPRGAALTSDGRQFLGSVSSAFDLIARSALELRPQLRRGLLRVWCMPGLAARWLAPG